MIESIATQVHGRYLVRPGRTELVLVGFHGYGESAETQLARLEGIPQSETWLRVSIQGLHRFYERRTDRVVASWMTRQDRELAIADNIAYIARVLEQVLPQTSVQILIYVGFSQGVAMAFRAAVTTPGPRCHVIAVGGDIPPELTPSDLRKISSVLVCCGDDDPWYHVDTFAGDVARLHAAGTAVTPLQFSGGHEWSREVSDVAGAYLNEHAPTTNL